MNRLSDRLMGLIAYKHTRFLDLQESDPEYRLPLTQTYFLIYPILYKLHARKCNWYSTFVEEIVFWPTLLLVRLHILKYTKE